MGDPQCPLDVMLEVLGRAHLLTGSGRLKPEVQLLSVGDHFDWGTPSEREQAATDGLAILAWLAAHPADQVLICAGNHDLSRVADLIHHDDAGFASLQALADAQSPDDPDAEAAFLQHRPGLATSGLARRDISSFREVQRHWVMHLLEHRRLRLAHAMGPSLLVTHAGVTLDEASMLGLPPSQLADAPAWERTLNVALDRAWQLRGDGPLSIPGLYRPGTVEDGEGVGVVFHRADIHAGSRSPPRRRYLPQRLPRGLTQVIGHIRDHKSRTLLGLSTASARDGVLRHLVVRADGTFEYAHGTRSAAGPEEAVMLYVDGSLHSAAHEAFELLDLDTLEAWKPPASFIGA